MTDRRQTTGSSNVPQEPEQPPAEAPAGPSASALADTAASADTVARIAGIGRLPDWEATWRLPIAELEAKLGRDLDGWRRQVLASQGAGLRSVADSMSSRIADANLAAFATKAWAPEVNRGLREAMAALGPLIDAQLAAIRRSLIESIRPAAFLATSELYEQLKKTTATHRRYDESLHRLGWWFPPSMPLGAFWDIGQLADTRHRVEVRQAMVELSRSRSFAGVVDQWMSLPTFATRRRFIRDGLHDHRRGRYRVAIPTLLPHIEGIAIEAFAPGSDATQPKGAVQSAAAMYDAVMGPAVVDIVTALWARLTFSEVPAGSRRLNRHLILHGRSTGYATAENSTKVLFALDLLASLVDAAQRHPERLTAAS